MTPAPEIARQTVSAANRVGRVCLTRGNVGGSRHPGNKTPETGLAGGRRSRPRTRLDAKFLETGKIQGNFPKNGSRGRNPRGFIVAKSAPCLTNSLLGETGNSLSQIRENSGPIREAYRGFSELAANGPSSVRRPRRRPGQTRETAPAGQMSSSSDPPRSRASSVVAWPRLWLSV